MRFTPDLSCVEALRKMLFHRYVEVTLESRRVLQASAAEERAGHETSRPLGNPGGSRSFFRFVGLSLSKRWRAACVRERENLADQKRDRTHFSRGSCYGLARWLRSQTVGRCRADRFPRGGTQ